MNNSNFDQIFIQRAEYLMGNTESTFRVVVNYHLGTYELIPLPSLTLPASAKLLAEIEEFVNNMLASKGQRNVFKSK
jgi:hypothetical protein